MVNGTYMRSDEVGDEVEAEAPPDRAEDVTRDLLHSPHQADAVVDLGKELEQKDEEEYGHDQLDLLFSDQFRHH